MWQKCSNAPLLVEDDDEAGEELEDFWHDDGGGGHKHVAGTGADVTHH